ncbi:MAG: nickel/cobalt transporter [Campylobacterales bacterium]
MSELYTALLGSIISWQQALNAQLATLFRSLESGGFAAAATLLGVAFVYGLVHAAGPGHGKALVGGYFLAHGGDWKRALKVSYLIALTHAVSALIITGVIYFLIDGIFRRTFRQTELFLYNVSGTLIVLIGLYLFYEFFKNRRIKERPENPGNKSPWVLALSVGIVPCPGVMTVLLFSLMLGHPALGVFAAVLMSVGMGLTIFVAGVASLGLRGGSVRLHPAAATALGLIGPALVVTLGAVLLLANRAH